jgi:hypothetical protein
VPGGEQQTVNGKLEKGGELSMSAFIVEDKTINNVVNWLRRDVELDKFSLIPHKVTELGFDTVSQAGQNIWVMRCFS